MSVEHLSARASLFNVDLDSNIYLDWVNQIETGTATFIKTKGPYKKVFDIQAQNKKVRVAYIPEANTIVKIYSVDGDNGYKAVRKARRKENELNQKPKRPLGDPTTGLVFSLKADAPSLGRFKFLDPADRRVRVIRRDTQGKSNLDVFLVEAVNGKGCTICPSRHFEGVDRGGRYEPQPLNLQIGNVWFRS